VVVTGQSHVAREGGEDEIPHLDARGRDDVAEAEVVVAQELGEVVEQHQQHPQRALVQQPDGLVQLHVHQVRLQELEQLHEQLLEHRPALEYAHTTTKVDEK
jgi:hypothetical protein